MARGQQLVRIDEEVDDPISQKTMEQVFAKLEHGMADADALLIEDYNKGALTPQVIDRAMNLARKRGVPVVVDPKYKNFFGYKGATVFKPNRRELEQAMGALVGPGSPRRPARDPGPPGRGQPPPHPRCPGHGAGHQGQGDPPGAGHGAEVYDVSGAGDTVTAWVGTALAAGASVREAAQMATYAAAIEVGKAGVSTVAPSEVLAAHEAVFDQVGKLRRGGLL